MARRRLVTLALWRRWKHRRSSDGRGLNQVWRLGDEESPPKSREQKTVRLGRASALNRSVRVATARSADLGIGTSLSPRPFFQDSHSPNNSERVKLIEGTSPNLAPFSFPPQLRGNQHCRRLRKRDVKTRCPRPPNPVSPDSEKPREARHFLDGAGANSGAVESATRTRSRALFGAGPENHRPRRGPQ